MKKVELFKKGRIGTTLVYLSFGGAFLATGGTLIADQTPYHGYSHKVPATIQAEDYDIGDEGESYHDLTEDNLGNEYRDSRVDIESSVSGGYNVGWVDAGEWLEYTIDVEREGVYNLLAQIASQDKGGQLYFSITGATNVESETISFDKTNGWQNWRATESVSVELNAGKHVVRMVFTSGSFNVDHFSIFSSDNTKPDLPSGELEAYPGYTGEYPNFTLEIDDRFDGFDAQTWSKGDGTFGESDCRFQPQGVVFKDGAMVLTIDKEHIPAGWSNDHEELKEAREYTCGELRTNKHYLYGRIETRLRNPPSHKASGYISSLFTYRNYKWENFHWREIDVETEGGRPTKFQSNLIWGEGTKHWSETRQWGAWEEKHEIGDTSEWRVYAIEWTPDEIRWFVDGQLQRVLKAQDVASKAGIPELEQQFMMNFWIPVDEVQDSFGGNKWANQYPMKAEYDWFRYYKWTPGTP